MFNGMVQLKSKRLEDLTFLTERRLQQAKKIKCYDKLSLAQKFSVSKLSQFGYDLLYVRKETYGLVAILKSQSAFVTVCHFGEINTTPNILMRKNSGTNDVKLGISL
ncbi:MAG: hypothetical protein ACI9YH_002507 [Colwellia sp.]|jgi:hypothetical protein